MLICQAGCSLPVISNWAKENLIKNYEGFSGIPATVGGAAINNAGSSNSEMAKIVKAVTVITENKKKLILTNSDLDFKTRQSKIKTGDIKAYIIEVSLDISKKDISAVCKISEVTINKCCKLIEDEEYLFNEIFDNCKNKS